jgi:NitT/TauT family transport system substrate-binding protein
VHRSLRFVLVLLAAGLGTVAVPQTACADDTLTLIAGNPTPGFFDTLELVADGAGFYKDEHLNVTKEYSTNQSTATQLVASGKADVLTTTVEPVLTGYEKGIRLQFFLSRQPRYSYVLAVLAGSPIHDLAGFSGATLGEGNFGSTGEVAAESMLAGAGLKRGDYSFVPIGVGAQGLSAIASKRVDGVIFPVLEIVRDSVAGNLTFRTWRHPILKDVGNVGFAATPDTLRTKAGVLQRFSRAIVKAAVFVRTNPEAAARLYLVGSGQKPTPEAIRDTAHMYRLLRDDLLAADPSDRRIGAISGKNLELYSRYMVDYGFAHEVAPASALATDRFIAFANDFDRAAFVRYAAAFH